MAAKVYDRVKVDVKLAMSKLSREEAFDTLKDMASKSFAGILSTEVSSLDFHHKERGRAGSRPRYFVIEVGHSNEQLSPHKFGGALSKAMEEAGFNASHDSPYWWGNKLSNVHAGRHRIVSHDRALNA